MASKMHQSLIQMYDLNTFLCTTSTSKILYGIKNGLTVKV